MSTILSDMANLFFDFSDAGKISTNKIKEVINDSGDIERKAKYIEDIYNIVLNSATINEISKIFIKSNKKYSQVASYYNGLYKTDIEKGNKKAKSVDLVKADISYTNKKLNSALGCEDGDNFFHKIVWSEISDDLWPEADIAIEKLKVQCNGKLINKEDLWINIPVRAIQRELSEEEFSELLNLITPYFNVQKSIAQLRLNEMKHAAGYLNYILKEGIELSETDKARRKIILDLMDKDAIKNWKKKSGQDNKGDNEKESKDIIWCRKEIERLQGEVDQGKQARLDILSKIGLYFVMYNNNGELSGEYLEKVNVLNTEFISMVEEGKKQKQELESHQEYLKQLLG